MMMMQLKWQLMYLCIIAIATVVVPGSSGFNEPLSLESSSSIPAVEEQAPNSLLALGNGPAVQPPSIKSPSVHQTIQGPMPFISPIKSTTLPPENDLTTSVPTQTPHDSAPHLSAEPPDYPDFPGASAPQDSTPPPAADLSHSLAPPLPNAKPPPSAENETSNNSTMSPSAESPHTSAVSPTANLPEYIPQLPTAEPPENLPIASYAPPPGVSLHNSTMQSPPITPEDPVVIPQPPVAKPPQSIALPLAAKPSESNPPLPVAEPPQSLTLTPPTEAPPVFPVLPPPSDTPSSPAPQNPSASPPKPVSTDAPPPTFTVPSVPSNASFLPPSMTPPSSDPPTTIPSPSSPLPPNAFSPPPLLIPPTMPSPPPQLNPPMVSSPPPELNPPTVSSPPPQMIPPIVSSPPPQLDPPILSSPPPQSNVPMVSSPPPQLNPPMISSPPPQLNPPMVSSPPPQSNPPAVSSPRPSSNPPIVSSPPPQVIPPIATSPLPQLNPPNAPIVSSSPPQMNPPIVSSPPPQLNPPMVSSPPPQLNPPMVSSPPPQVNAPMVSSPPPQPNPPMVSSPPSQVNAPMVSSPPPQPNPPMVSSPPPQVNPPMVSSSPPQANPPMVSSPPPQLNPPMVSSPPPQANPPMVSSPPTQLNPPMASSPPPRMIPPTVSSPPPHPNPSIVSSPPPQLIPPIASSPPPQLIPLPALPPNSAVPSNATVPPPLIASPPDSSLPPLAVPPHASAILSPPLPSHASPPLPQLAPSHGSPPPSKLPFVSPPRSSSVPQSVPPHPSPPLAPTSPAISSHPSYAPPPSEPSRLSVPPSPVMQQTAPAAPPLSSQRKEPPKGVSPPSLKSPEPSPASKTLPEAAPPAHQTTSRSQPPSSHQIEAPKHSPFMRSNTSEPNTPPSSTPPPSNSPISGRYPLLAPSGGAPDQSPRNKVSPYHAPSKPKVERHQANAPAPFSFRVYPTNNGSHHSLRRSSAKGSPPAMSPLSSPPENQEISSAPSPLPRAPPGLSETPFLSPKISPSGSSTRNTKKPRAPPTRSLPPPPPNADCAYLTCAEPFTNTPPGSPCGCVWPMQVGLRLSVPLYTFFPLVTELSREIAAGVFMKQSQVRVMGANAASESEKTIALVNLVPLNEKFDNVTSDLTFQRFWHKQVVIDKSTFGDYDVLYVRYPGLPPSPPMSPADMAVINGMPYSVRDPNQSNAHPLGVDVTKQKHKSKLNGIAIVAIVFSAIVGVLICCSVAWFLVFRHKTRDPQSAETPRALPSLARSSGPTGNSTGSGPGSSMSVESSLEKYAGSAKTFSTSEIEKATDNLNPSRIIGEGGFGLVYGGILEDETNVAVKVLKREDQQGGREFLAEVEMLSRLHHRNLVKLIGICTDERLRCLVYELIPNGSVDSHLHGADKEIAPLDWPSRMKIALGAARGLAYLHEDSSPRVIHRDFKSSNILLENDFTPKVSDFGLARSAMDGESRHISTRVMGTFGYVAPEYAMTGHLLVKSDVYSYGVVLLELLTGRKPVDMSQPPGQENLVAWTRPFLTTKESLELILDHSLGPDVPLDSVAKVAAIASMCVQPEVSHRPFMGEVVQALKLVCNECDDSKDGDSSPASPGNLSVDYEAKASPVSETHDYVPTQYSPQKYFPTRDVEKGLSVSENFSSTAQVDRQASDSFRRHSASGPLKTVKGRHFWRRIGRQSNGNVSEHGIMYRLWAGSH